MSSTFIGRRVYWRACALLAVVLLLGCDHGKRRTEPQPPPGPKLSFVALDREHQRLVRDYEPVSAAMTAYELAFRDWRLGRLSQDAAAGQRPLVPSGRRACTPGAYDGIPPPVRRRGRSTLFVSGLRARAKALAALPDLPAYRAAVEPFRVGCPGRAHGPAGHPRPGPPDPAPGGQRELSFDTTCGQGYGRTRANRTMRRSQAAHAAGAVAAAVSVVPVVLRETHS